MFIDGGQGELLKAVNFSLQLIRIGGIICKDNKKVKSIKKEFFVLVYADEDDYKNIAASFEHIASVHLIQKLKKSFKEVQPKTFAIVGGASANLYLRSQIEELLKPHGAPLLLNELKYCSDNAAMIGRVAIEMYEKKMFTTLDELDISPRSAL